jgi:hypothetical protein
VTGKTVRVYIYPAEYECPYDWEWTTTPFTSTPEGRAAFERQCVEVPREQYLRWRRTRKAFEQMQQDLTGIMYPAAK